MKSCMKGDFHVQFCGKVGVKFPCLTRLLDYLKTLDFVSIEETQEPNNWQMKKLDKLQVSQDKGELDFVTWNQAKEELSKKYGL